MSAFFKKNGLVGCAALNGIGLRWINGTYDRSVIQMWPRINLLRAEMGLCLGPRLCDNVVHGGKKY